MYVEKNILEQLITITGLEEYLADLASDPSNFHGDTWAKAMMSADQLTPFMTGTTASLLELRSRIVKAKEGIS